MADNCLKPYLYLTTRFSALQTPTTVSPWQTLNIFQYNQHNGGRFQSDSKAKKFQQLPSEFNVVFSFYWLIKDKSELFKIDEFYDECASEENILIFLVLERSLSAL